jgi:AcrR family transcriptional regulator
MEKTIDRRAARTRRALHQALIALILRKGYEATTIQDIIDAADVGRSTFYAHYAGKEDLLRGGFEALRAELARARLDAKERHDAGPLAFSRAMFEHACGYKQVYRALVGGRGGVVATSEMRRVLSDMVQDELSGAWRDGDVSRELAVQFVVSTFLAVLTSLLTRKPKVGPAEADRMFRRLALAGIGSSLPAPRADVAAG